MSFLQQQVTLQNIFGANRQINEITVDVIIDENTTDSLSITKHPVQEGASITDHSFLEPTILSMRILQQVSNPISEILSTFATAKNSALAQLYKDFTDLQSERIPFKVITPKRIYNNMLIAALRLNTDKNTESILSLNITFQQVIIVSISATQISRDLQKTPAITGATESAGKKSFLFNFKEAVSNLFGR